MEQLHYFEDSSLAGLKNRVNAFLKNPDVHYIDHNIFQKNGCWYYLLTYRYRAYYLHVGHLKIQFANRISKYLTIRVIQTMTNWMSSNNRIKDIWKKRALKKHGTLRLHHRQHYSHPID